MDDFKLETKVVHMVNEVRTEKGYSFAKVRCGATLEPHPTREPTFEYTGFESRVTCQPCKWKPRYA